MDAGGEQANSECTPFYPEAASGKGGSVHNVILLIVSCDPRNLVVTSTGSAVERELLVSGLCGPHLVTAAALACLHGAEFEHM